MNIKSLTTQFYTLNRKELLLLLSALIIIFTLASAKFQTKVWWKCIMSVLLLAAAGYIFAITVFTRAPGSVTSSVNFTPFYAYYTFFTGQNTEAMRTCIMNMILFAPLGLFAGDLFPKSFPIWKKVLCIVIPCCLLSIGVESLQYLRQCGEVELDDVINNTFGAFLGVLCVPLLSKKQVFMFWNKITRK